MANTAQKVSDKTACSSPQSEDLLMILKHNQDDTYTTRKVTVEDLFSNTTVDSLTVSMNTTPESNSTNGYAIGQMWSDDTYLYVVRSNGIARITLDYF